MSAQSATFIGGEITGVVGPAGGMGAMGLVMETGWLEVKGKPATISIFGESFRIPLADVGFFATKGESLGGVVEGSFDLMAGHQQMAMEGPTTAANAGIPVIAELGGGAIYDGNGDLKGVVGQLGIGGGLSFTAETTEAFTLLGLLESVEMTAAWLAGSCK